MLGRGCLALSCWPMPCCPALFFLPASALHAAVFAWCRRCRVSGCWHPPIRWPAMLTGPVCPPQGRRAARWARYRWLNPLALRGWGSHARTHVDDAAHAMCGPLPAWQEAVCLRAGCHHRHHLQMVGRFDLIAGGLAARARAVTCLPCRHRSCCVCVACQLCLYGQCFKRV